MSKVFQRAFSPSTKKKKKKKNQTNKETKQNKQTTVEPGDDRELF
jgi:hypothetical protein